MLSARADSSRECSLERGSFLIKTLSQRRTMEIPSPSYKKPPDSRAQKMHAIDGRSDLDRERS